MKICVFIGSRANFGRLRSVIKAIKEDPEIKLQLIYACSFYNAVTEYEPDYRVQAQVSGDDTEAMALTAGLLLTKITDALKALKPDVLFVHGDRFEVLAASMAAAYMNIPIGHSEGGEDTGTIDQKVRYAISALADYHFPVTALGGIRLLNMKCSNVHPVGSTALDGLVKADLTNNRTEPYIVILHHPNTTDSEDITQLIEALECINIHKVWVNPNVDAGSKSMLKLIHKQPVEFVKDLPPEQYARLLNNAKCGVGNSSSFIKEAAFLGTPTVIIGRRQEHREHGQNVLFAGYEKEAILKAVLRQIEHGRYSRDYRFGDGTAAKKILEVLACISLE